MEGNGKKSTEELLQQLIDAVHQVRAEQTQTNAKLDQTREELGAKIDQTREELGATNAKLDQTREELGAKIETTNAEVASLREDLGARIDGVRLEVVALRALSRADARQDEELRGRVERIEQHLGLTPP